MERWTSKSDKKGAEHETESKRRKRGETGFEQYGGYIEAKEHKLQLQNEQVALSFAKKNDGLDSQDKSKSRIFAGARIHVNGYTKPSMDVLKEMIVSRGGKYVHFFQKTRVTHMVATNLPFSKVKSVANTVKVVHPNWILDCVAAGRLLQSSPYLLFNAEGQRRKDVHRRIQSPPISPKSSSTKQSAKETVNGCDDVVEDFTHYSSECSSDSDERHQFLDDLPVDSNHQSFAENNFSNEKFIHQKESATILGSNGERLHENVASSALFAQSSRIATAGDKNFLKEFYGNSRLHHISMWCAQFKQLVKKFQSVPPLDAIDWTNYFMDEGNCLRNTSKVNHRCEQDLCWKPLPALDGSKVVLHVDMDCFFVSVGMLKHPEYIGHPVAVTHSRGNGPITDQLKNNQSIGGKIKGDITKSYAEIASCSYEARSYGVKNGMLMKHAIALCPNLKTIQYNFDDYYLTACELYHTVARYSTKIQAVSCDECFVDVTHCVRMSKLTPCQISSLIAAEVYNRTKCHASVGVSANMLLARLATKKAKPNGVFAIDCENQNNLYKHLDSLLVGDLPGVGFSCQQQLESFGIHTVYDIRTRELVQLKSLVGAKTGEMLFNYSRGIDNRELNSVVKRKSVSAEVNYGIRLKSFDEVSRFVEELTEEVHRRLLECEMMAKTLSLKLKVRAKGQPMESKKFLGCGICDNINKSKNMISYTNNLEVLKREVVHLMKNMKFEASDLRGVGVTLSKLVEQSDDKSPSKFQDISHMFKRSISSALDKANANESSKLLASSSLSNLRKTAINTKLFQQKDSLKSSKVNFGISNLSEMNSKNDQNVITESTLWEKAAQKSSLYLTFNYKSDEMKVDESPSGSKSEKSSSILKQRLIVNDDNPDVLRNPFKENVTEKLMATRRAAHQHEKKVIDQQFPVVAAECKRSGFDTWDSAREKVNKEKTNEYFGVVFESSDIDDECTLLYNWISNLNSEITELDVDLLNIFCDSLIDAGSFYDLTVFLRCLRRLIVERSSSEWNALFNNVFSYVQNSTAAKCGFSLKI